MNYFVSDSQCTEHNVPRLACRCPEEPDSNEVLNLSEESEQFEESTSDRQSNPLYAGEESEESEESTPNKKNKKVVLGTRLSTIKPVATHWLISNFVPKNSFSVLAGREGLGKSTLAIEWASQASQGKLQGDLFGTPIDVAYVASEDSPEQTLAPRFIVAGANRDRVHLPYVEENGQKRFLSFPKDLKAIKDYVLLHEIRLLIIDPVPSVIDEKLDTYKDSSVRQALEPLGELARTGNVTVLGLLHVGKSDSPDFNNRVLGSRAFTAVPRAVLGLARDNDESGEVLLVGVSKSNLGSTNVPMKVFRLESVSLEVEDGTATVGRVYWLGEREGRIDQLLDHRISEEEAIEQDEQTTFLMNLLESNGGEISAKEGIQALKKAGFSVSGDNLGKAKNRARIASVKDGVKGWKWKLKTRTTSYSPDSSESSDSSNKQREFGYIEEVHSSDSSDSSSEREAITDELREALDSERTNCLECGEQLSYSDVQCEALTHSFCE
jgi:hypothetical protein